MSRLKILVFVKDFARPTHTFIYNDIIELSKKHQIQVICNNRHETELFPFNTTTIPFKRSFTEKLTSRITHFLLKKTSFPSRYFGQHLQAILSTFKPDIIHCHFGPHAIRLIDSIGSTDIPIFITFHGYDASSKIKTSKAYRNKLKALFKQENIYPLFVSEFLKKNLECYSITSTQSKINYLGIDVCFFNRQSRQNNHHSFLQVSRFVEKKGHQYTLRAFRTALGKSGKDFRLILVGDGPLRSSIEDLAKSLGIHKHIVFYGLADKTTIKQLMEDADYFIHHSITDQHGDTEGLPTAIMEAMAMELPILSSFHSGIPELVIHEKNGLLCQEKDIQTLSQQIMAISEWEYLPINRTRVEQVFSLSRHIDDLEQHYERVLNKKSQ